MKGFILKLLLRIPTLLPVMTLAAVTFQETMLDKTCIAYERDVGDVDMDGDPDSFGIRNWNAAPTWIYRNTH